MIASRFTFLLKVAPQLSWSIWDENTPASKSQSINIQL